jgi:4-carboxymuconolactone decarboxylase
MRTQLLGEEFTNNLNKTTYNDATMEVFRDIAVENVFGALWTRPGLDLKTRTLICVVSDTAMGRETELVLHLRMALRQGWTETELTETMVHLSGYIGVPLVRGAMLVASEVFAAVRQEAN